MLNLLILKSEIVLNNNETRCYMFLIQPYTRNHNGVQDHKLNQQMNKIQIE